MRISDWSSYVCSSDLYAQEAESYNFDLPAQDLGDALLSVAAKAGWELYAPAEDLAGVSSPQLRGNYTVKQAIERLLRGTNLVARFDDRAVIIRGRTIAATAYEQPSRDAILVTGTRIERAPHRPKGRRVGTEWGSPCNTRGWRENKKKKKKK